MTLDDPCGIAIGQLMYWRRHSLVGLTMPDKVDEHVESKIESATAAALVSSTYMFLRDRWQRALVIEDDHCFAAYLCTSLECEDDTTPSERLPGGQDERSFADFAQCDHEASTSD